MKFKTKKALKTFLMKNKFLTSDDFVNPDREFIFLENDSIQKMNIGDFQTQFKFKEDIEFRLVDKKFENLTKYNI